HAIDPLYARNLGIDLNTLILSQPDSGEQAMEIVDILAKSGAVDLIVVDSVAALVPIAELEGEMRDMQVGVQARLMSKALRKITGNLHKNKTTVIFVNQIREKIGVMFGNPETTTGG
ncbi:DNA recombination/repair protein RecA, partial [Escherichia coli]|nr:DNA recombination/repair protein RecA [Escherichia coli]